MGKFGYRLGGADVVKEFKKFLLGVINHHHAYKICFYLL